MDVTDIIGRLRDVHLPNARVDAALVQTSVVPLLIVLSGFCAALAVALWRRSHWRRQTRAELARISQLCEKGAVVSGWLELATLLRRLVLLLRADPQLAGLTGERWLRELDALFDCDEFLQGNGRNLLHLPYQRDSAAAAESASARQLRALLALLQSRIGKLSPRRLGR